MTCSSIHLALHSPWTGSQRLLEPIPANIGRRQGTPRTSCQFITGLRRQPLTVQYSHIHTCGLFTVESPRNLTLFGWWEEARILGGNPCKHRETMQTPHTRAWGPELGPSCWNSANHCATVIPKMWTDSQADLKSGVLFIQRLMRSWCCILNLDGPRLFSVCYCPSGLHSNHKTASQSLVPAAMLLKDARQSREKLAVKAENLYFPDSLEQSRDLCFSP